MEKQFGKERLLYLLLKQQSPVTTEWLSVQIGKSSRTVRNYLDEIEREYPAIHLERKSKVGIQLAAEPALKLHLLQRLKMDEMVSSGEAPDRRQRCWYILKTLFLERYAYTIQLFADELYCSKSTVQQDLKSIEDWLSQRNLRLKRRQNQGVWLEGEERSVRLAFKNLLDEMRGQELEMDEVGIKELDYRINLVNYQRISKLLPQINLLKIQKLVQETEIQLKFCFTEQAFQNLVVHLAIAVQRIREKKTVEAFELAADLVDTMEYHAAEKLIERLEAVFSIQFPAAEIAYAAIHILGSKIQEDESALNTAELLLSCNPREMELAKEIMQIASGVLSADLVQDKKLLIRLVLHLRPTIVRMRQGLGLVNPLLQEIKREYAPVFAAAWACNSAFERVVGLPLNEDEVAYLALHLAVALETAKRKIRALVICASGIGTSQLMVNKLTHWFPMIEILAALPYNKLTQDRMDQVDLIVSTVRIARNMKTVCVSALLSQEDRLRVERFIADFPSSPLLETVNERSQEMFLPFNQDGTPLLTQEDCFLDDDSRDLSTLIQKYAGMLERQGFAHVGFAEDALQRERKGSTYIGHGIAIPHAKDVFVRQSKVCFVRLKQPIIDRQEEIKIVMLLCLKFADAQSTVRFFKRFYTVLSDSELLKNLYEGTAAAVIKNLNTGGMEDAANNT